ncbi:unnamed protein product [Citrullus colocynthis]|uniref:Uncharacterized protein n=1 Tax=Citrullus colocynthis TaxID=252529 RepID=A0ABP0YUW3_9ROSI
MTWRGVAPIYSLSGRAPGKTDPTTGACFVKARDALQINLHNPSLLYLCPLHLLPYSLRLLYFATPFPLFLIPLCVPVGP